MRTLRTAKTADDDVMPPLRYDLAERAERASQAGGDWSIGHLRIPARNIAAVAVLGIGLAFIFGGLDQVWGVALGATVVAGFFAMSSWAVARAGEVNVKYTLPVALVTYGLKFLLLGLLLATVPVNGPVDRVWLGATIGICAVLWVASQAVVLWRTPMMYVDLSAAPADTAGNLKRHGSVGRSSDDET